MIKSALTKILRPKFVYVVKDTGEKNVKTFARVEQYTPVMTMGFVM